MKLRNISHHFYLKKAKLCDLYLPVLAGASRMGGLVRVARILRLVVHVSGRQ